MRLFKKIKLFETSITFQPYKTKILQPRFSLRMPITRTWYGQVVRQYHCRKERATITTSLRPGSIAVVKIGEKAVKVAIK